MRPSALRINVGLGWGRSIPAVTFLPYPLPFWFQDTVDATDKYIAIAYNAGVQSDIQNAYARTTVASVLEGWTMRVSSALGAGETLDFRLVIDGTPDATMVISLGDGDIHGEATGSLDIPADSLVAIEAIVGGTLASKLVRGGVLALREAA